MAISRDLRLGAACLGIIFSLTACGGGGSSSGGNTPPNSFYEPFTSFSFALPVGEIATGLWLVNAAQPTTAAIQVTAAGIDIPGDAGPTFYDWTYDPASLKRNQMQPMFFAYGSGGHIFGVNLTQPDGAQQLSSGTYTALCSAVAVQAGPFSSSKSYVVAQVALSGSTCDTTWIIPTDASSSTAPSTPSESVTYIATLKDPSTGLATGFLMQSGHELDVYSTGMTKASTAISGPTPGTPVTFSLIGTPYMSSTAGVVEETSGPGGNTPFVDDVYLVTASKATHVGRYSVTDTRSCGLDTPFVIGAMTSSSLLYAVRPSSGAPGLTLFSVPTAGGVPTAIYTDTVNCGALSVIGASDGRLVLDELNLSANREKSLSLSVVGPSGQTPVTLLSIDPLTEFAFVNYVIDGNAWVVNYTLGSSGEPTDVTTHVVDLSNGNTLKTYAHAVTMGDIWDGFNADGSIDRNPLFIASGHTSANCDLAISMSSIASVDPNSFASDSVSTPGSLCAESLFGPAPLAIGSIREDAANAIRDELYYLSKPSGGNLSFGKVPATLPSGGNIIGIAFGVPVY